jgi:hypothetical protein
MPAKYAFGISFASSRDRAIIQAGLNHQRGASMTRTIAAFLTLAGILTATETHAQFPFRKGVARQEMTGQTAVSIPTPRVYTYSYYSRSSLPARTYVGYGNNDFPYHGAPYGHPYDPYTWAAMSNSYQAEMSRYYAPPLK